MRNPLNKRLPREFLGEFGKYLVIFLFMTATIGFVSGFLVAASSMIKAYDESFEKYNIEDGHFVLRNEATEELMEEWEKENVTLYPDFYLEEEADHDMDGETDATLRIFGEKKDINKVCLMKGRMPKQKDEIAVDRMYADNNGLSVGDTIEVGGKKLKISGLIAISSYSTMFSDNNDMMFDATMFGVAVMTDEGFVEYGKSHLYYDYAWKYDTVPADEEEEKQVSEDFAKVIASQAELDTFIPRYINKAINFTGEDMGGDKNMMLMLLYILIVILAFVFAVTINHTIAKEASVIGTLRASGYTKMELFLHYLTIPLLVTLFAAVVGNILGYSVFKDVAAGMYYGSYSLTTYVTIWNAEAFVLTTVIPLIIMLLTTGISLAHKLSLSPLKFIRRDLNRSRRKKAVRLPKFKFFTRFRLRIVLQNRSSYFTLFVGILFANLILIFGMMLPPILDNYKEDAIRYMPADYQYILKAPVETSVESAEKYCVTSLKMQDDFYDEEEISIYGIVDDSDYIKCDMPENGVVITSDFSEKYQVEEGDKVTLKENYGDKTYEFKIQKVMKYPTSLSIFMSDTEFAEVFDMEEGYFNGYYTNKKLTDLEDVYVASCITEDDLTKLSRQLDVSMGNMMDAVNIFAIILFALLIYLLTKLILEKNTTSISMVKILGYENHEIARLYLIASVWVVILSILISLPLITWIMQYVFLVLMKGFGGWFTLTIEAKTYAEVFLMGLLAYVVVALMQFRKIQKIPMDEALKNVE